MDQSAAKIPLGPPPWLKDALARALRVLSQERWLAAAYLYGSSLRTRHFEDVDLAFVPRPKIRPPNSSELCALALKLDRTFQAETDCHLSTDLPDSILFRIVREGYRFLTRDELAAVRFESQTLIHFLDFKPTYDYLNNNILERRPW